MRPQTITQTGIGASNWIPLEWPIVPFNVGFGVIVDGTLTYDIEHTFNNVLAKETAVAFQHPYLVAQTSNRDGNYSYPVSAIRVNVTSGTGSVTLIALQGRR